jgi:type VI secretion system secreted protein Hcp
MRRAHEYEPGLPTTPVRPRRGPRNGVLALQRSAGNRAVGAILARQPGAVEEAKDERTRTSLVMPRIGTIDLESFTWGRQTPPQGGGPGKASFTEIQVTSKVGEHSPELQRATADGRYFKQVEIFHYNASGAGVRIKLTDVMITSYSLGGSSGDRLPVESWTLSFAAAEHKYIRADE